jgi:hypothetical protein
LGFPGVEERRETHSVKIGQYGDEHDGDGV